MSVQLDSLLEDYLSKNTAAINAYTIGTPPTEINALLEYIDMTSAKLGELSTLTFPNINFDPKAEVDEAYKQKRLNQDALAEQLRSDALSKKEALQQQYDAKVAKAQEYNKQLSDPYREEHEQLLMYKDSLKDVFRRYDITPLSISISDNITAEEFDTLIEQSIAVCKKYYNRTNNKVGKVLDWIKNAESTYLLLAYGLLAFVVCYFALPLLSVPIFIYSYLVIHNMYKDIEKLKIAYSLMSQVDYVRFVDDDAFVQIDALDLQYIDEELQTSLEELPDLEVDYKKALDEASVSVDKSVNRIIEAKERLQSLKQKQMDDLQTKLNQALRAKDDMLSEYVSFPGRINTSSVMSHSYALGTVRSTLDYYVDVPASNIVFANSDHEKAINTLKVYLCNMLLSVRPLQLTVEIFDPKTMCADFTEFFTEELRTDIQPAEESECRDVVQKYRDLAQLNTLQLDKFTMDEFNQLAEERDTPPKPYKLLILLSGHEKYVEKREENMFDEMLKFSTDRGIYIWMLYNTNVANCLFVDGISVLQGVPKEYTTDMGKQTVATLATAKENYRDKGLIYNEKFGPKYIPENEWWTRDTIKGINMYFGLQDGDPDKYMPEVMGDKQVHAILAGATGAGKSAAINQMLVSLITQYPPSELQMVYVDFKNVEAAKFAKGYEMREHKWMEESRERELLLNETYYDRLSYIPHFTILSGTTDGEYALSIFEYLMDEMTRRQQIINKAGVTKVQELRENILKEYHNTEGKNPKATAVEMRRDWEWYKPNVYDKFGDLPRMLVVMDEFQVMFNTEFVPQKIIDKINGKIVAVTKLARAMGIHLWFTSQSMKGTLSKDTLANFSLRGALRCTSDVSNELLGNPAASTITAPFGYMYTNSTAGQDAKANKFWRVPFLHEKFINSMYVDKLNQMLEPCNEKHNLTEFYDEKVLVPGTEMLKWYDLYDVFNDPNTFIVGERASFSTNKAPLTFKLKRDTGENILVVSTEKGDMMNLVNTLMQNIIHKGASMIINCQDKNTIRSMSLDKMVPDKFKSLVYPDTDPADFVDALDGLITTREQMDEPQPPLFVVLIQWELCPKIAVDIKYKVQDQFKALLRRGPSVGVHFILALNNKSELPRPMIRGITHKLLGTLVALGTDATFTEDMSASKLPTKDMGNGSFAIYERAAQNKKFKIYQWEFLEEEATEVII